MLTLTDCPSCGLEVQVPPELLGQRVKCPSCDQHFLAPRAVVEVLPTVARVPVVPVARPRTGRPRTFCCPFCLSTTRPLVRKRTSTAGWILLGALIVVFFPVCWLGLLLREKYHVCFDCGIRLS